DPIGKSEPIQSLGHLGIHGSASPASIAKVCDQGVWTRNFCLLFPILWDLDLKMVDDRGEARQSLYMGPGFHILRATS
ncbi:hypothetical protein DVH24_012828, partial [Malus domestica]